MKITKKENDTYLIEFELEAGDFTLKSGKEVTCQVEVELIEKDYSIDESDLAWKDNIDLSDLTLDDKRVELSQMETSERVELIEYVKDVAFRSLHLHQHGEE